MFTVATMLGAAWVLSGEILPTKTGEPAQADAKALAAQRAVDQHAPGRIARAPLPYTVEKSFTKIEIRAPIYVEAEPGSNRLWGVLQAADAAGPRIVRIDDDPAATEVQTIFEVPKGIIYSVAFDPDFAANRAVYLFINGPKDDDKQRFDRVVRYTLEAGASVRLDPKSEQVILEWASAGHDGGGLAFGPDRLLYITTGDGTGDSDTDDVGQTLDDLLGAVLRIDPRGATANGRTQCRPRIPLSPRPARAPRSGPMACATRGG